MNRLSRPRSRQRGVGALVVLGLLGVCGAAAGRDEVIPPAGGGGVGGGAIRAGAVPGEALALQRMFPGLRVAMDQRLVSTFYGVPMNSAATPDQAAAGWITRYSGAFGAGALTLQPRYASPVMDGKFTAYGYDQFINGVPVEHGMVTLLVLNGGAAGAMNRVVYAGGHVAEPPAAPAGLFAIDGPMVPALAMNSPEGRQMEVWSQPQLVVFMGEGAWTAPVYAWKIVGEVPNLLRRQKFTFFVDAATGKVLYVRNEVLHADVTATVKGMASPGVLPDIPSNPAQAFALPNIRGSVTGGSSAYGDAAGLLTIPTAGTAPVSATVKLGPTSGDGRWVWVTDSSGTAVGTESQSLTPGTPGNFLLNPTPSASTTAQVNAFIHASTTHNFIKDRAPAFTALDASIHAIVNLAQTCNAFYDGNINFFSTGGGCNNTAYSTVIAHEYGHHIVNRRGLGQGGFGEGFGDCVGMLQYNDGIVGRFFTTGGGAIRNPSAAAVQYPCTLGAVHDCGQMLGGIWWEIRGQFVTKYGATAGLDRARNLFVAWYLITGGGQGSSFLQSAHPTTAIEVLTVDDDDGNLENGTPNYTQVCTVFANHTISCPAISQIGFEFPSGLPTLVAPGLPAPVRVDVVPIAGTPMAGSGMVFSRIGTTGAFASSSMTVVGGPSQYQAMLPAASCGQIIQYYFSAKDSTGATATSPKGAPTTLYSVQAGTGVQTAFQDDMETDKGWSGAAPGDTATTGRWGRMDPQATAAQPEDDTTAAPGVNCWVTDGRAGTSVGDFDVDNGFTTLTTPKFDLSGMPEARISYNRWYSNNQGSATDDTFTVSASNDDGATWKTVETLAVTGPQSQGGWNRYEFRVADILPPTANMRVRFVASDLGTGSIVEAAIDDFKATSVLCTPACKPDLTGDGKLDIADFAAFQNLFALGDLKADFNGDGKLDVQDFTAFQNQFALGC